MPAISVSGQQLPDSLRKALQQSDVDSIIYQTTIQIYNYYEELNRDSALFYADRSVLLSRKNNKKINEAYSLSRKAYQQINMGRYAEALHSLLAGFAISENAENNYYYWAVDPLMHESQNRLYALSCTHHIFGILMRETLNPEQQIVHFREAKRLAVEINNPARSLLGSLNLGRIYLDTHRLDSALFYENQGEAIIRSSGREKYLSTINLFKGLIYKEKGDTARALSCFYECIRSGIEQNNLDGLVRGYRELTHYHLSTKNKDSALYYAISQLDISKKLGAVSTIGHHIGIAYENLYLVYQAGNHPDSAYKYLALAKRTTDSINNSRIKSLAEFQKLTLSEQQRSQNIEKEKIAYQNKIRVYFLLSGIGVLLLLAIIFYRNNQQKQKAKLRIEEAYDHLKSTQQQLIQSEKMASLGELTAGIAHEIQNPLNFVNNFSEVSGEMIVEAAGSRQEAGENSPVVTELLTDIRQNLEKINHHGKRADSIVKSMLQHSHTGRGEKEPTDVNALADEYLRAAFHNQKANDASFYVDIQTSFDPAIGKINIIPQDIGRVLLNLYNNAFYTVGEKYKEGEKQKTESEIRRDAMHGVQGYQPQVSVSTIKKSNHVEITVKDNGNGIPQKIIDKVFQPFFTTKPTGQGTGLGLSLAYDIVKAHGGEINVASNEGRGTEFLIILNENS